MTHVVFLNGPPRSGKDIIGRIITDAVPGARAVKFAHALKVATHALFAGLQGRQVDTDASTNGYWSSSINDDDALEKLHNDAYYEAVKGEACSDFFGKTPREAYIAVSELLCKPLFGQAFFGRILRDKIVRNPGVPVWAITDSGFADEAVPIIQAVGRDNCTLVRVRRHGCTFERDSRSYIDLDVPNRFDVMNDLDVSTLAYTIRTAVLGKF